MKHIADRIKDAMETSGISVSKLAELTGIPRMTLSRRLANPTTFTLGELVRIAEVLGITTESLVIAEAA
jgi:transcriptional regulator with XRE-family HTH domain